MPNAKNVYEGGCRARKSGENFWLQWPDDNRKYPTSIEFWKELQAHEISVTWKERHAKGVPVKMKLADLDAFLSTLPDRGHHALYGMSCNDLSKWGIPHAKVIGGGLQASFCNFRYKQKGGGNA